MRTPVIAALSAALVTSLFAVPTAARATCSPTATILRSPRGPGQVQATALNDRGDVVGFAAPLRHPRDVHAILWKNGKVGKAVDLGLPPGYVASEAYSVNNDRVVAGLLYDRKGRTFPFRWEDGRMTVLKGPKGRRQEALLPGDRPNYRNLINDRGQIAGTLIIAGRYQAVRWSPDGRATLLGTLPGHAWSYTFGINEEGVVSGWSRKEPKADAEENPVIWPRPGKVVPLKTAPNRTDGIAEATNRSGLTVGYLGNVDTAKDPERDQPVAWDSRQAKPRLLNRTAADHTYAELVDVNNRGQAAGMSGTFTHAGFPLWQPAIWQAGWAGLRPLPIPTADQKLPVVFTQLSDINNRGMVVGMVAGLDAPDFSALRRLDPVVWTCAFGR
jgi:hypothetical protein